MKPLNKKQRDSAIIKFGLVYLLSLLILIVPVFSIYQIPKQQCKSLEEQNTSLTDRLDKCTDDLRKLENKTDGNRNKETELNILYKDYLDTFDNLSESVEAIDRLILERGAWDDVRISNIQEQNDNIVFSKASFNETNERFSKYLGIKEEE